MRVALTLSTFMIAAMIAISVFGWVAIPENTMIATHWNLAGEADGFSRRDHILFCMPLLAIALTAPARAQHMDKALFLEIVTSGDTEQQALLLVYIRGLLNGLESADIALRKEGRERLACPPDDAPLEPGWLIDKLVAYYTQYPDIPGNISVGVTATLMLAELFPCPQRSRKN